MSVNNRYYIPIGQGKRISPRKSNPKIKSKMNSPVNRSVISKKVVEIVRPIGRKVDHRLDGKEDGRGIFFGSFRKVNGDLRSMEFVFSKEKMKEVIKNGEMIKVKEIIGGERGNLQFQWRYFNCGKMVGDLVQCN